MLEKRDGYERKVNGQEQRHIRFEDRETRQYSAEGARIDDDVRVNGDAAALETGRAQNRRLGARPAETAERVPEEVRLAPGKEGLLAAHAPAPAAGHRVAGCPHFFARRLNDQWTSNSEQTSPAASRPAVRATKTRGASSPAACSITARIAATSGKV